MGAILHTSHHNANKMQAGHCQALLWEIHIYLQNRKKMSSCSHSSQFLEYQLCRGLIGKLQGMQGSPQNIAPGLVIRTCEQQWVEEQMPSAFLSLLGTI